MLLRSPSTEAQNVRKLLLPISAALVWLAPAHGIAATDTSLVVQEPAVLESVESTHAGFSFRFEAAASDARDNASLARKSARYRSLTEHLREALAELQRTDPLLGPGMAKAHRLFDARWLVAKHARYELAAVVNRLDRRSFAPDACGELRLIYRLRYERSRLPFTVNAVYWMKDREGGNNCAEIARRWDAAGRLGGKALAEYLVSSEGPLAPIDLEPARLKSLEVNLQSVRWPSMVRPDLGAHAEYMLRVFQLSSDGQTLVAGRLENTPDVERIASDPRLKAALLRWIGHPENLERIDAGIAVLPEPFLAREATSVSPRGLTRLANRPFARLVTEHELRGLDLAKYRHVKTPASLLRRLDDLSCMGCHQARGVAGFHALGIDRADTLAVNTLAVTGSPHLMRDLPRRRAWLDALLRGQAPIEARPLSERAETGEGGYGSHCGLGDAGFATWTCDAGLSCRAIGNAAGDQSVGQCFPEALGQVGDPCEPGRMQPHPDGRRDKVVGAVSGACTQGVCEVNRVGFPEGMCAVRCAQGGENVSCGAIAILAGFNGCLDQGRPFAECIERNVRPAGLRRCDDAEPCRDDYLCVRTAGGTGACIPPYFLFQMRVDGHPTPQSER